MSNQKHQVCRIDNKSGYKGVAWNRKAKKWRAQIYVNGTNKHLGYFKTVKLAHIAYIAAAQTYFGDAATCPPTDLTEYQRQWKATHKENVSQSSAAYRINHREQINAHGRVINRCLRLEVIEAYGGICDCCGETLAEFLTIDHINGSGKKHRDSIGGGGANFYRWLKKQEFPKDRFRLLCYNCNCSLGNYGYCPHKEIV